MCVVTSKVLLESIGKDFGLDFLCKSSSNIFNSNCNFSFSISFFFYILPDPLSGCRMKAYK